MDISTEERRKAIASLAYKVAKTKTGLDTARKELVADEKARLKAIDTEGSAIWNRLEALQAEVRKPLTEWERGEETRLEAHEDALRSVKTAAETCYALKDRAAIEARFVEMNTWKERNWQEFNLPATRALELLSINLNESLARVERAELDAEELKTLRAAEAERKAAAARQAIADEATAAERRRQEPLQADRAAEAERERQRVEAERHEAEARARELEAKAERERVEAAEALRLAELKAERERHEAAERERQAEEALKAERARHEREKAQAEQRERDAQEKREREAQAERERHEQELREAEVKAHRERVAAIEAERERVAAEAEDTRKIETARAADQQHRDTIAAIAAEAIISLLQGMLDADSEEIARRLVEAIIENEVPHVEVIF
jgi:colicin import membrane protein